MERTIQEVNQFLAEEIALRQDALQVVHENQRQYMRSVDRASRDRVEEELQARQVAAIKADLATLHAVRQYAGYVGGLS